MGKRYFCEYCNKFFSDNATNRRNHLRGVHHHRMRKLHYDMCREPSVILHEEATKRPCKQLQQTGDCHFGANCRYSHLTEERRKELERQILAQKESELKRKQEANDALEPTLEDWLAKRAKKAKTEQSTDDEVTLPGYSLPPALIGIPNIPPSLLPPPPDALLDLPVEEWG